MTNEVRVYEDTRRLCGITDEVVSVRSHDTDPKFVVLEVGDKAVKVLARDLAAAITNATNTAR